jgi:hypothetical protein
LILNASIANFLALRILTASLVLIPETIKQWLCYSQSLWKIEHEVYCNAVS